MVLSASGVHSYDEDGSPWAIFGRQVMWTMLGLFACWVALRLPVRFMRRTAFSAFAVTIVLLVLVLIPGIGHESNGTRGWFVIGGISMQPSELTKIAFAIWGAHLLATRRMERASLRELLVPLIPAAVIALALIVAQPDLGQTVSLGIILLALLWYAGLPLKVFVTSLLAAMAAAAVLAVSEGYRSDRVRSWLDPAADAQGAGYQARQAKFALANGGVFGDGLGQGTAKWNYLPNAHNDFIFAIIGEELGFVGAFGLLALFGLFAYTGMRIARRSADPFLRLLTATATMWVVGQVFINVGYVIGLLPVTGIQLPLISAGGTSTATTLFMIGLMANAARHEPEAVAALRAGREDRMNRLLRLPLPAPYAPTRVEALRDRLRSRPPTAKSDKPARAAKPPQKPAKKATRTSEPPRRRAAVPAKARSRPTGAQGGALPVRGVPAARSAPGIMEAPAHGGPAHWKVSVTGECQGRRRHGAQRSGSSEVRPVSVVLAGGGTAGHVEPAMAVADALTALDPGIRITALGTARGLETRLVPERGYRLELITPCRCRASSTATWCGCRRGSRRSVRETRAILDEVDADVVIGFGGYVALPAYLAARGGPVRRRQVPVVVHEANARAGLANRVGARTARRVLSAVPDCGLSHAEVVGMPVRATITALDRTALRGQARAHFGFADDAMVLLVFGGSQGAASINRAVSAAAARPGRRRHRRCCTPTDRRTPSSCPHRRRGTRRTWRCPT